MSKKIASLYAEIGADTTKLDKGLAGVKKKLTGGKAGFEGMATAALKVATIAGGVTIALRAVGTAIDWIDQGAGIKRASDALVVYAGGAEEAAEAVELIKRGVGGLVTEFEATQAANKMFAMGLAKTGGQAAALTDIAITLGSTMGKGPKQALEDFTLMLANQSIPRLDTFGIAGATVRERMRELAEEGIAPADRQTRFMIATMEEAEGKMNALDEAGYTAGSSLDQLKTVIREAKETAMEAIADGIMPLIDAIVEMGNASIDADQQALIMANTFEEYVIKKFDETQASAILAGDRVGELEETFWNAKAAAEEAGGPVGTLAEQFGLAGDNAGDAATSINDIALALGNVTQAELAAKALEALTAEYVAGNIGIQDYKIGFSEIATSIGDMDTSAIMAQVHLAELDKEYKDGTISTDEYVERLAALKGKIDALEDKTINVNVVTRRYDYGEGGVGGGPQYQHGGVLGRGLSKVGEAGWEYIWNGMVIPHRTSRELERLGFGGNVPGFQYGSEFGGMHQAPGSGYKPSPTATLLGAMDAPTPAGIAAQSIYSSVYGGGGGGGGAITTVTPSESASAAEAAAQAVAEVAVESVQSAVLPVIQAQNTRQLQERAEQASRDNSRNRLLQEISSQLGDQPTTDDMGEIMNEAAELGGQI